VQREFEIMQGEDSTGQGGILAENSSDNDDTAPFP